MTLKEIIMGGKHTTDNLNWIFLETKKGKVGPLRSSDKTKAAKVDSGWLLKSMHFHGSNSSLTTQAMIFIPDLDHEWNPEEHNAAWERISKKKNPNYGEYTDRLRMWDGWLYKDSFFNGNREMHISLVYVPIPSERNNDKNS
jgi:hypothetical protein